MGKGDSHGGFTTLEMGGGLLSVARTCMGCTATESHCSTMSRRGFANSVCWGRLGVMMCAACSKLLRAGEVISSTRPIKLWRPAQRILCNCLGMPAATVTATNKFAHGAEPKSFRLPGSAA